MKTTDLIRSLEETLKSFGDLPVSLDLGVDAKTGKHKYATPSTAVLSKPGASGKRTEVLVIW